MSCSDFGIVEKMPLLFVGPTETVSPQFVPVLTAPAPVGLMPIANAGGRDDGEGGHGGGAHDHSPSGRTAEQLRYIPHFVLLP